MKIELTDVYGFKAALRAMRNPMDSWSKSDSTYIITNYPQISMECQIKNKKNFNIENFILGKEDEKLSQKLTKAGGEHCKHLRMIWTWTDITLPRYVWQEFDTYKHLEKISCSTMHKLTTYILDNSFFEYPLDEIDLIELNNLISEYKNSNQNINLFYKIKNKLPEGFLQKRTVNINYQTLLNMHNQRNTHKLEQWSKLDKWILVLPYFTELTGVKNDN